MSLHSVETELSMSERLFVFNIGVLLPPWELSPHYSDVIMSAMASQVTSLAIVYPTVYSGANQRKHQSSASLAFVRVIHRWPVNSPHKLPVTRKTFPFGEVIMKCQIITIILAFKPVASIPHIYIHREWKSWGNYLDGPCIMVTWEEWQHYTFSIIFCIHFRSSGYFTMQIGICCF